MKAKRITDAEKFIQLSRDPDKEYTLPGSKPKVPVFSHPKVDEADEFDILDTLPFPFNKQGKGKGKKKARPTVSNFLDQQEEQRPKLPGELLIEKVHRRINTYNDLKDVQDFEMFNHQNGLESEIDKMKPVEGDLKDGLELDRLRMYAIAKHKT